MPKKEDNSTFDSILKFLFGGAALDAASKMGEKSKSKVTPTQDTSYLESQIKRSKNVPTQNKILATPRKEDIVGAPYPKAPKTPMR